MNRYYGAIIPSILNVVSMQGYLVINCIIGGQALATVSDKLTDTLGIVIISLISLAVSTLCHMTSGLTFGQGHILWLSGSSSVSFVLSKIYITHRLSAGTNP